MLTIDAAKFEIRNISTQPKEIDHALQNASRVDPFRYPLDYIMNQSQYFGVYSRNDILGGFVIVDRGRYRILDLMRAIVPGDTDFLNESNCLEIGGVWFDPSYRCISGTNFMWRQLVEQVQNSGREYVVLGVHSDRIGLKELYSKIGTTCVYDGTTELAPFKTYSKISLRYAQTTKFITGAIKEINMRKSQNRKRRYINKSSAISI